MQVAVARMRKRTIYFLLFAFFYVFSSRFCKLKVGRGQEISSSSVITTKPNSLKNWPIFVSDKQRKVYSMRGQDGTLEFIFANIGVANSPGFFVEFGFSSDKDYSGSNTFFLKQSYGWTGLLMDGGNFNSSMNLRREYITQFNIIDLFIKYKVPREPDYVSIDLDSCDIWIFESIISNPKLYTPRVVSVEYNAQYPLKSTIAWPQNCSLQWDRKSNLFGSSLGALKLVGDKYGYTLVDVVKKCDAFFVRTDLLGEEKRPSFEKWELFTKKREKKPCLTECNIPFLSYQDFSRTGNLELSQKSAEVEFSSEPLKSILSHKYFQV